MSRTKKDPSKRRAENDQYKLHLRNLFFFLLLFVLWLVLTSLEKGRIISGEIIMAALVGLIFELTKDFLKRSFPSK